VFLFISSSRHERVAGFRAGEYAGVEGIAGLGTHTTQDLYPEFQPTDFREYLESVIRGSAKGIYTDRER
jgi:hypothetical protein